MKRFLTALLTVCLAGPLVAAPGEWHVYLDASVANRLQAAGDTLWCCTNGGILVFDLRDSTFTQLADGLSLPSNDVSSVVLDETGSLWAGFLGGYVARIDDPDDPEPFIKRYGASDGMLADSVTALEIVGDDIYYGSPNGVAKFFENFHSREPGLTDALEGVRVNDLLSMHPDTLWIATESGIVRFARPTLSLDVFDVGQTNALCAFDGRPRAATVGGVLWFTGDTWELMPGDLGGREAVAIGSGGGELVAVTAEGAWRWNGSLFAAIDIGGMKNLHNDIYRMGWNNILRAVAVDGNGTPWVGGVYTPQLRGVYVSAWIDGAWRNRAPNGPPHNASALGGLDAVAGGGVWLSTEKNGVGYRDPDGTWNNYTLMRFDDPGNDRLLSYRFNNLAILYDSQGVLWLNAQNYDLDMIRVNDPRSKADDEWAHFPLGGAITSNRYVAAAEDPAGNRWFLSDATLFESGLWGIDVASPDTSDWFAINPIVESRMGSGAVFGCAFDGDDRVYLALRGHGLQLWITQGFDWDELTDLSNDIWVTIADEEDLASTDFTSIALTADGTLWAGTVAGLVRYRASTVEEIDAKKFSGDTGLLGSDVRALAADRFGALWVGSNGGLDRIGPDGAYTSFTSIARWRLALSDLYPPDVVSPLPSAGVRSLAYDETTDLLWIGTDRGLASIDVTPAREAKLPVSSAILYPNPVHLGRGDDALRIERITGTVDIRVYTVEGELVHEIDGIAGGEVAWDLLTLNGFQARSGIYLVRIIDAEGNSEIRKVAVIR